jgi:mannosyltransferase OCH1-like enzyme
MKSKVIFLILLLIIFYLIINNKNENFKNKIILSIHTVFRLEENILFLEEWIKYHKYIGFDRFYLYDNSGSIGENNSNSVNKYDINFNELINNKSYIKNTLNKILKKYPEIIYIKWQPRNDENQIIYAQDKAFEDYINKYSDESDWTAFIDMDEFIFKKDYNKDYIKKFIHDKEIEKYTKLKIEQKKFKDRLCNLKKSIFDIDTTIEVPSTWGPKIIAKNSEFLKNISHNEIPHSMNLKKDNVYNCDINELRFNHYNLNAKQFKWMQRFFKKKNFLLKKDNSMKKFKIILYKNKKPEKLRRYNNININKCSLKKNKIIYNKLYLEKFTKLENHVNSNKHFNKTIYIYWDKGELGMKPLIKSIYLNNKKISEKYGYKLELITKNNIHNYIDVPKRFYEIKSNFQSDICRYYILDKYGGIYMDADIILYNNMDKLLNKLDNKDMLILEEYTNKIGCAFIIAKKNTFVSNFCKKYVENILNSKKTFYWTIIGPDTIEKCYKKYKNNIILLTNKDKINKSINFFDWRKDVGKETYIWYKKNENDAVQIANNIKKNNYPIIITWTLYRIKDVSDTKINNMVMNDKKSIFYHLINN